MRAFWKPITVALVLLVAAPAAMSEVVIVASTQSPIDRISTQQLNDIYLGRLNRLPGGQPVTPIDISEQSTTHADFYRRYLGQTPAQIRAHWSRLIFTGRGRPPKAVNSSKALVTVLTENPAAIGYLDSNEVSPKLKVIAIVP